MPELADSFAEKERSSVTFSFKYFNIWWWIKEQESTSGYWCLSVSPCAHGEDDFLFCFVLFFRLRHQSVPETPSEQVHGDKQEKTRPPQICHGAKTVNQRPQAVARQHYPYHSRKWSRTRTLITFGSISQESQCYSAPVRQRFHYVHSLWFIPVFPGTSEKEMSPALMFTLLMEYISEN